MDITSYLLGKNSGGGGSGGKFKPLYLNYNKAISSSKSGVRDVTSINKILQDLLNIDTSLVADLTSCFAYFNGDGNVTGIKLPKISFESATIANSCFQSSIIDEVDLSGETFPNCLKLANLFYGSGCKKVNMNAFTGEFISGGSGSNHSLYRMFQNASYLEELEVDSLEFSKYATSNLYLFTNCGSSLPEGTYTKVYVKDTTEQAWILNLGTAHRPEGWSTANVIVAGSSEDHRND